MILRVKKLYFCQLLSWESNQNPLYIIQQTSSNDTIRTKQTLKKLNLWGQTAVGKSAWIKACLSKIYERNVYNQIYLTVQKVCISNATIQYILDTKRLDVLLANLWKLEKNLKKRLLCCLHYGLRWFNPDSTIFVFTLH